MHFMEFAIIYIMIGLIHTMFLLSLITEDEFKNIFEESYKRKMTSLNRIGIFSVLTMVWPLCAYILYFDGFKNRLKR